MAAARALVGARLVRIGPSGVRVAKIVEVEAYLGDDLASHARRGRTPRNEGMFGPPGHAYVYLVYGMYRCLNVVTEPEGRAAAVLIRSLEPVVGEDEMRASRADWARSRGRAPVAPSTSRLAHGPGLACIAMSVGREHDRLDLCDPTSELHLCLAPAGEAASRIETGPRVGIDYAPEPWRSMPLRFWAGSEAGR